MLSKILVAYDGSESSARAFPFALELAKRFGARLTVLAVAQLPEPAAMVESSAMLDAANEHFAQDFQRLLSEARSEGVETATHVVVGHPAEQIVHRAAIDKSDLIVMGHRGHSAVKEWLLGSTSKRVITYAPCSVTVVR
jgi:nucleotide-binding universal stress UspA family protein